MFVFNGLTIVAAAACKIKVTRQRILSASVLPVERSWREEVLSTARALQGLGQVVSIMVQGKDQGIVTFLYALGANFQVGGPAQGFKKLTRRALVHVGHVINLKTEKMT